jgi:hypothetical protein
MHNSGRMITKIVLLFLIFAVIPASGAMAESWEKIDNSSWCNEKASFFSKSVCEVREITINEHWGDIAVEGSPNGSIEVEGWDKDRIFIQAKVQAKAGSKEKAKELMSEIELVADGGEIKADGPKFIYTNFSGKTWSVSYRIKVPVKTDLELASVNGGITVEKIQGEIEAKTVNGGINLEGVTDDVNVRTVNGGITAELDSKRWNKKEFEARTTNGSISLVVPEDCSAELEANTVNGGIHIDFPITIQGRIKKNIETTLGDGGGDIDLRTINGGVNISKK